MALRRHGDNTAEYGVNGCYHTAARHGVGYAASIWRHYDAVYVIVTIDAALRLAAGQHHHEHVVAYTLNAIVGGKKYYGFVTRQHCSIT